MHPALRLDTVSVRDFLGGFAILNAHMTGPTHDQRFPATSGHDFGPARLCSSSVCRVVTVRLNTLLRQVSLRPPPNRTYAFPHIRLSEFS